jgi:hypothetical protein
MRPVVKVWCGDGREGHTAGRLEEAGLPVVLILAGRVYARVPKASAFDEAKRTLIEALRHRHGTASVWTKDRGCAPS